MMETNANTDFCGIRKLLSLLEPHGFTREELRKIAARIKAQTGADIILTID